MTERADSMTERDEEAVTRFIERFAGVMHTGGMPRMAARAWAALLATDSARLTSAELAEMLQISPAAVSGAVRYLTQLGLAARERDPGSRRDHYVIRDDVWYEAIMDRDRDMRQWVAAAHEGVEVLGAGSPAGERMAVTEDFLEFLRGELGGIMARWREHRTEVEGRAAR